MSLNKITKWLRRGSSGSSSEDATSATDSAFGPDDLVRLDFVALLPVELAVAIVKLVDARTLALAVSRVSLAWAAVGADGEVWRNVFLREWGSRHSSLHHNQVFIILLSHRYHLIILPHRYYLIILPRRYLLVHLTLFILLSHRYVYLLPHTFIDILSACIQKSIQRRKQGSTPPEAANRSGLSLRLIATGETIQEYISRLEGLVPPASPFEPELDQETIHHHHDIGTL